jgi:GAF domain-containing protein
LVILLRILVKPKAAMRRWPVHKTQAAVFGLRVGHSTVADVWKAACEDIVECTGATRASVWVFDRSYQNLSCVNLYDGIQKMHSLGGVLHRSDYPDYFRAITNNAKVVVRDALTHPATKGFTDVYFKPKDVRSLLDFIVLHENVAVGVLCCEQSGAARDWTPADVACLQGAAMLIGTVSRLADEEDDPASTPIDLV